LADDWQFLLYRRGFSVGAFLDPHNDHIVVAPIAIYKTLLAIFGMESALPFQLVSTAVFLLSAVLLFSYLRRRLGDWLALLGSCLILFLGASWQDLLWSFQVGISGSIATGLGALLALDRDDRRGDRVACLLLVVSTCFSELGIAFIAGGLVSVALGRRPWRSRLYIPLVPSLLYAVWWLGWGRKGPGWLSLDNVVTSPKYVFDAVSQAIASLLGLATTASDPQQLAGLSIGRILFVIAIGLSVWQVRRLGRVPRGLWVALAIGGAFWFLAAFNQPPESLYGKIRAPNSVRYQYPSGVFVLLIAAELLRGERIRGRALGLATALTAAAAISGVILLHRGYSEFKQAGDIERVRLGAVEIARPAAHPDFHITLDLFTRPTARTYLSAVDAFGSPAYDQSELASRPEDERVLADRTLASALEIKLGAARADASTPSAVCRQVRATSTSQTGLILPPGQVNLRNRGTGEAHVWLARFSDAFSVELGTLEPRAATSFAIPADRTARPWRLGLRGNAPITVCESGST
jgi:hypothetical protein